MSTEAKSIDHPLTISARFRFKYNRDPTEQEKLWLGKWVMTQYFKKYNEPPPKVQDVVTKYWMYQYTYRDCDLLDAAIEELWFHIPPPSSHQPQSQQRIDHFFHSKN